MEGLLDGKVALISGTGGGQGRAAALAFAREGARVVGCDVDEEAANETVRLVEEQGGQMISLQPLDLADPTDAGRWVDSAVRAFGGIDILYNNAGALHARGPFEDSTLEQWDRTIRDELTIVYVACRAAWTHLVSRGGGVILNTASVSGHVELFPLRSAAHGAAKAGVIGLTRMLAAEGAEHGIRALSLSPGVTRTPATQRFWSGTNEQRALGAAMIAKVPSGRAGEPEEVAEAAVFLASERASYINATDLLIDGGLRGISFTVME
ncbi:SDR family NAD(P)-dependent oxidoreductase [Rhizobium sp. WYJ-E13]|uniref:SDR family NAD(P)-dependent oxidoreductase n=1 Tax=Rhizobium sp. WYJ-E13 TaxID=2849093 RepID=UPI001C1EC271|nr:SDR family NAD(P)-dependent oxidoreductase [Rhizobium sp. WYJ-E13]QWW72547.1 SDR family oxidoreductase [Rhizobium sp. WYJ-E13]